MNVTRIRAENFRSWKTLDLDLPPGVTAITGPNGAGKTSLLSVIDTALFGATLRDYLSDGETTLLAEVEFEHGGETYRVRRSYTAKGGGKSTLDLDQAAPAALYSTPEAATDWLPLTCETQKATQERINHLIGLTPATWENSAYLRQGGGSWADPSIPPRQRKEMLSEALGLDIYGRMLTLARGDRAAADSERSKVGGQIETLAAVAGQEEDAAAALAAARLERDACRQTADELRAMIDSTADVLRQAEAAAVERQRVERELEAARAALSEADSNILFVDERLADVAKATERRPFLERAAAQLGEWQQKHDDLAARLAASEADIRAWTSESARLREQIELNNATANGAAAAIERLEADQVRYRGQIEHARHQPDATCHTCGQALHDEARDRAVIDLETALAGLMNEELTQCGLRDMADAAAKAAREQYDALVEPAAVNPIHVDEARKAVEAAQGAVNELAALAAREERIPELRAAREQAVLAAASAEARIDAAQAILAEPAEDITGLREIQTMRGRKLDEAVRAVSEAEQRIGHADARLAQAIAARHQLDEQRATHATLSYQLEILDACIAAYGPGGIPALILENSAIPQLESEANRVLAELGTEFRVELATQRAKRSSDGLIETLDVNVHSSQGARPYELFSGGERCRINLALRLALAQLLAHRRGADVRVFLVDEPEGLDASGMDAFASVLKRLETVFERQLVISHHADLRDSFDSVLEVERGPDGASMLAGHAVEVAS